MKEPKEPSKIIDIFISYALTMGVNGFHTCL